MGAKFDIRQGTLALMILKTLDTLGPLHGYGIARRIEQTSGDLLSLNYGTLYPALLKLEQEGSVAFVWGTSENNRKAKFYELTREGRKELVRESREWNQTAAIVALFSIPPNSFRKRSPVKILRRFLLRISGMLRPSNREQEFSDELESHPALAIDDLLQRGVPPDQARRRAILQLGGLELTRQTYRDPAPSPLSKTSFRMSAHHASTPGKCGLHRNRGPHARCRHLCQRRHIRLCRRGPSQASSLRRPQPPRRRLREHHSRSTLQPLLP